MKCIAVMSYELHINTNSIKNLSNTIAVDHSDASAGFPVDLKSEVLQKIAFLERKGIHVLKVCVDCKEFNFMWSVGWYDWLMATLGDKFELEISFLNNSPFMSSKKPITKHRLAETVECFINNYGNQFDRIELYRNPEDKFSPINSGINIFADELVFAATFAAFRGKKITIGGIQAGDFEWLMWLINSGFFEKVEAIRLDKEGDNWSSNTNYLEQAVVEVLQGHNFKTQVFSTTSKFKREFA